MFGLTFKNYYKIVITYIPWLQNLFHNLTTHYARNNYVSLKAIKFWKLITWIMNLKTRMQKYRGKIHDGGYATTPLYASSNDQKWRWWLKVSWPSEKQGNCFSLSKVGRKNSRGWSNISALTITSRFSINKMNVLDSLVANCKK